MVWHNTYKEDARPKRGAWAPGEYLGTCCTCKEGFTGDKRALECADCAYKRPEPVVSSPAPSRDELAQRFVRLSAAVRAVCGAAYWTADRDCDAEGLWTELRDAAGMSAGFSPNPRQT